MVPSNFPGVLQIDPDNKSIFHKDQCEFGENGNEKLEYFFKYLLPRIDPSRTKYKNKRIISIILLMRLSPNLMKHLVCWYQITDQTYGTNNLRQKRTTQMQRSVDQNTKRNTSIYSRKVHWDGQKRVRQFITCSNIN